MNTPAYALVTGLAVAFVVMLLTNNYIVKRFLEEKGKYYGVTMFILFNIGLYGTALDAVFVLTGSDWF